MNYNLVDLKSESQTNEIFHLRGQDLVFKIKKKKNNKIILRSETLPSYYYKLQMTSSWENVSIFFLWWMIVFLYRFRFETDSSTTRVSLYKD